MRILEAMNVGRVTIDLAVSDRAGALAALAEAFVGGDPRLEPATVSAALDEREHLASTNMGNGVAIPHARVAGLGEPQLAVAVLPKAIPFGESDAGVRILVALLSDETDPRAHLQLLARLARVLNQPPVRDSVMSARGVDQVLTALALAENEGAAERPRRYAPAA